jgi:hypothetical protein
MTTRNIVEHGFIEIQIGSETIRVKWNNLTRTLTDPVAVHQRVLTLNFSDIATLWSAATDLPASFDYLVIVMDPEGVLTSADDELDIEITGDAVVSSIRMVPGTPLVLTADESGGADVTSMDGLITLVRAKHNGVSGNEAITVRCIAIKGT